MIWFMIGIFIFELLVVGVFCVVFGLLREFLIIFGEKLLCGCGDLRLGVIDFGNFIIFIVCV